MRLARHALPVATLLLGAATLPALAGGLSASSAAGGSSASSAGSASLETSSNSSSRATGVAEGPYQVIDVAAVPERAGTLRMTLRALADGGAAERSEMVLYLPQQAYDQGRLSTGHTVTARHRPYGLEFARADTREPFFLVVNDEWMRELPSRPVVL